MMAAPMGAIWLDAPAAERARGQRSSWPRSGRSASRVSRTGRRFMPCPAGGTPRSGASMAPWSVARLILRGCSCVYAAAPRGYLPGCWSFGVKPASGKVSLLDEFIREADGPAANHWLVALCQADQTLRQSLNPFRYWLRRYFDQSAPVAEHNRRAFDQRLDDLIAAVAETADASDLAAELQRTRSFLGALVDLYEPGRFMTGSDAAAVREHASGADRPAASREFASTGHSLS